jgi:hypothetical protein
MQSMTVTEIPLRLEPVSDDPFISSLAPGRDELGWPRRQPPLRQRTRQRVAAERARAVRRPDHRIRAAG